MMNFNCDYKHIVLHVFVVVAFSVQIQIGISKGTNDSMPKLPYQIVVQNDPLSLSCMFPLLSKELFYCLAKQNNLI